MAKFLETSRIRPGRARAFLLQLANLREDRVRDFMREFRGFLFQSEADKRERISDELASTGQFKGLVTATSFTDKNPRLNAQAHWWILQSLQAGVRAAWGEPDFRVREWRVFELRRDFWLRYARDANLELDRSTVPPLTWFEQAMIYLVRQGHNAKVCENESCQIEKFYFATKGRQRFCSDVCAVPSIRASKRRWWNENRKGKEQ